MEFFAVNGKRPIRLSEDTRAFAFESLNHRYGLDTMKTPHVSLDQVADYDGMTRLERYDSAILEIVRQAPIRICENERISGAATLGDAISHLVPACRTGEARESSVSHLTVDFETVLKKGMVYIQAQAEDSFARHKGTEREAFLKSCLHCIDCMKIWHTRYLEALRPLPAYQANVKNLERVPFYPATTFYEAVQSLWFVFSFLRLCGNWPGIGRIDRLLGDYLERDLRNGTRPLDEAREILAHFFIKGCEWITGESNGSGDAQHYQNILLGGVDEDGRDVTNQVTYLVLDIIEELGIGDFPTSVRIGRSTDERFLTRVAEVIRLGGGVIAVYNEDLVIESLTGYGYDLKEARRFANDGCWEVQIPGKTFFCYVPFDSLAALQHGTLRDYDGTVSFDDFESLYQAFLKDLKAAIDERMNWYVRHLSSCSDAPGTVIALFEEGCVENGLAYHDHGSPYQVLSPHIGGLPDAVNSLYAIKKLVFDEKKVSFSELISILRNDWEGQEALRQYALNKYAYFGNDNDEADEIAVRIIKDFADYCDEINGRYPYQTPAGISTFGRQIAWAPDRRATPFGKKAHEVLSGNYSPTPGTDKEGATAIIRSYCKADLKRTVTGAALDVKLLPSAVNGENGLEAVISLLRAFCTLNGFFLQLDIADAAMLREAQKHPEDYQNLSVRVTGWNARFVTMNKEWQDMIIEQTGCDFR